MVLELYWEVCQLRPQNRITLCQLPDVAIVNILSTMLYLTLETKNQQIYFDLFHQIREKPTRKVFLIPTRRIVHSGARDARTDAASTSSNRNLVYHCIVAAGKKKHTNQTKKITQNT